MGSTFKLVCQIVALIIAIYFLIAFFTIISRTNFPVN